jgi:hypothetical protein
MKMGKTHLLRREPDDMPGYYTFCGIEGPGDDTSAYDIDEITHIDGHLIDPDRITCKGCRKYSKLFGEG